VVDVAAGFSHACVLTRDGEAYCWGTPEGGSLNVPRGTHFVKIDSGNALGTCGIEDDGGVLCWGLFPISEEVVEVALPADVYVEVQVGMYGACAITDDGRLVCAGDNTYGQLDVPE
jgi:alpha-tubulin suppressor-like RCC1 family protein